MKRLTFIFLTYVILINCSSQITSISNNIDPLNNNTSQFDSLKQIFTQLTLYALSISQSLHLPTSRHGRLPICPP